MFRGFNLQVTDLSLFREWKDAGQRLFRNGSLHAHQAISSYVSGQVIEAKRLQDDWFGGVGSHVFISHCHKDLDLATSVAGFLNAELGLKSFIDSYVWGHADDLLKEIDKNYCRNGDGKTYNYEKRNRSTSHVHMMLNAALTKMIDSTECILFLNTPESIVPDDLISTNSFATASPWIYSELLITQLIKRRAPKRSIGGELRKSVTANEHLHESMPSFHHEAHLSHLTALTVGDLQMWRGYRQQGERALDALYRFKPEYTTK